MLRDFKTKTVTIIRAEGTDDEARHSAEAHVQPDVGVFPVDTPIYEGDIVEYDDPRGGKERKTAAAVAVYDVGDGDLDHIEVTWGTAPPIQLRVVKKLQIEGLHDSVVSAASDLFADGHYSQAIFEALKALDNRVKTQSGLDLSGRTLMEQAFKPELPRINLAVESGRSAHDEQEGFRFIFMGVAQGIRNPKGHELVEQDDPQRALEYLAMVSVLFRRLDDASED